MLILFYICCILCPILCVVIPAIAQKNKSIFSVQNFIISYLSVHAIAYAIQLFSRYKAPGDLTIAMRISRLGFTGYGFLESWFLALILSTIAVTLSFFFFKNFRFTFQKKAFLFSILFFFIFFLRQAFIYAYANFPINDAVMVYAVLSEPLNGSVGNYVISAIRDVILPSLIFAVALYPLILKFLNFKNQKLTSGMSFFISITLLGITALNIKGVIPIKEYIDEFSKGGTPAENSEFYKQNYIFPDSVKITPPEKKQNLIFLLVESLESSFADKTSGGIFDENYIPHLTKLAKENISFSETDLLGGVTDVYGTGWTIAGITGKLLGVPYALNTKTSKAGLKSFLPNLKGLPDVLIDFGYQGEFLVGSPKEFSSKETFAKDHGNFKIQDLNSLKEEGRLPKNYKVFWGVEDKKLFQFAKEDLAQLATQNEPFFLIIETVNTHYPKGYLDTDICAGENKDEHQYYANVLKCSDKEIFEFIEWLKAEEFYKNTTVVILGDHLFMGKVLIPEEFRLGQKSSIHNKNSKATHEKRRGYNTFLNSLAQTPQKHKISSFDIFPTTLEAMGFEIEGRALGLGRSLFSEAPTLLDIYGEEKFNEELAKKTLQYGFFQGISADWAPLQK